MTVRTWHLLVLVAVILAIHFPSLHFSLYHKGLGVDVVQHILAGVLSSCFVLWFIQRREWEAPAGMVSLAMAGGGCVFGLLWELYEYARWQLFPETYVYANNNWDSLHDQALALSSGVLVALFYLFRTR